MVSFCIAAHALAVSVLVYLTCLLSTVDMSFQARGPTSTQIATSMASWRSLVCSISRSVIPTQSVFSAVEMQLCRTRAQAMDTEAKTPLGRVTQTLAKMEASVAKFLATLPAGAFQEVASKA